MIRAATLHWNVNGSLLATTDDGQTVEIDEDALIQAFVSNPTGIRFFLSKITSRLRKQMPNMAPAALSGLQGMPALSKQVTPLTPTLSDDILGPQLRAVEAQLLTGRMATVRGHMLPVG